MIFWEMCLYAFFPKVPFYFSCLLCAFLVCVPTHAAYLLSRIYILMLQLTGAGTSGANGLYAAASARGSEAGNATPQHPGTEARRVKGTVRPLRTAQMDCVPRVRPLSPLGTTIIIIIVFILLSLSSPYTLTVTWQIIRGMSTGGVCWRKKIKIMLWIDTDAQCMVMSALFLLCAAHLTYCMSY